MQIYACCAGMGSTSIRTIDTGVGLEEVLFQRFGDCKAAGRDLEFRIDASEVFVDGVERD